MKNGENDKVPDGYVVKFNMYGVPYLDRKRTPQEDRVATVAGLVIFVAAAAFIVYLLCF